MSDIFEGINLNKLILDLIHSGSVFTDIRIEEELPALWNTPDGWKVIPSSPIIAREDMFPLLKSIDADWEESIKGGAIDRPVALNECRLRCNVSTVQGGTRILICIRKHPLSPQKIEESELPVRAITSMLQRSKGLIIVTGATGSAKTTTVASMVNYINRSRRDHIICLENPIEFTHTNIQSVVTSKEMPTDFVSFDVALFEALRQAFQVLVIGEVRDRKTAEMALTASESGHLVILTMHTSSSVGALGKLLNYFPENEMRQRAQMLSSCLIGVLCQSLIPNKERDRYVLAYELLLNSINVRDKISDPTRISDIEGVLDKSKDGFTIHMNTTLMGLLMEQKISKESAIRASYNPIALQDAMLKEGLLNKDDINEYGVI